MRLISSCLALLASTWIAVPANAQLTDLQPGRNFPTAGSLFGGGFSENIDVGDCDNDGDLDVIVGNGGDGAADQNRIYINNGGLQGGTVGTFTEGTATRFAGVPLDTSRDIEFMDLENDGDLDIYVSNRGNNVNGGEVSRFYINQGGVQGGTIGFYLEDTANRWGNLVSVPSSREEGVQDGMGPWRDWSCDCDFGDLDDDGDLDLFHSSYGPNINGTEDSRIFLNDGNGVFNEHWPWMTPGGDIQIHTLDIDLVDFDGDYDLDVFASSRDSQARVWINNCYEPIADEMFTDITQQALLDQGVSGGGANYESEFGDLDGDGDFDVWMKNFPGINDSILENTGPGGGVPVRFSFMTGAIVADAGFDENEVDFLDYDGDGDLDAFAANFSGTNWLYQGGVAQGLIEYHRTGTTSGGGQAAGHELPQFNNAGTSLDGECADLDNDGDTDILVANDAGQQNRYMPNQLGVPDTHAPTFERFTDQCDKPLGSDTVIHAQVRDNENFYNIAYYDVDLVYSVDGGGESSVDMFAQGGQQFRGVIPAQSGTVSYRIEATDRAGNTGVSSTRDYVQAGAVHTDLRFGLAGTSGVPSLSGTGTWQAGTPISVNLASARPSATVGLFIGLSNNPTPAFGGTLVPVPFLGPVLGASNALGALDIAAATPKGLPCGLEFYLQYGVDDPAAIGGVALSNALAVKTP